MCAANLRESKGLSTGIPRARTSASQATQRRSRRCPWPASWRSGSRGIAASQRSGCTRWAHGGEPCSSVFWRTGPVNHLQQRAAIVQEHVAKASGVEFLGEDAHKLAGRPSSGLEVCVRPRLPTPPPAARGVGQAFGRMQATATRRAHAHRILPDLCGCTPSDCPRTSPGRSLRSVGGCSGNQRPQERVCQGMGPRGGRALRPGGGCTAQLQVGDDDALADRTEGGRVGKLVAVLRHLGHGGQKLDRRAHQLDRGSLAPSSGPPGGLGKDAAAAQAVLARGHHGRDAPRRS